MRYKKNNEIDEGKEHYKDKCYDRDWLEECDNIIDAYIEALDSTEENDKYEKPEE